MTTYFPPIMGGIIIGLACWLLLAGIGRVASVSAILGALINRQSASSNWRIAFLLGLVVGGAFLHLVLRVHPVSLQSPVLMIPAGLLVGFGTVLASGCTTGHAVNGLGRRSMRSLIAVVTFLATGVATALVVASART